MQYRRAQTPGGTYFFTVVTFRRRKLLCIPENVDLLRMGMELAESGKDVPVAHNTYQL